VLDEMTFKVDVETVDPLRRRLAVEVPAEEVSTEIEKAYATLARAAKVPGFRPGRVPRTVLERLFGDRVRADVFARLIQDSYSGALEARGIEALGQPEIVTEQAEPGAALRYSATVEVKPDLVVSDYGGLEVERPRAAVTETDVDGFLERLRHSFAQVHPVTDRSVVQPRDVVTIDYEARQDGKVLSRAESRDIEIGANSFPPEFDAHLIDATVGSELSFSVTYPAEHGAAELAGKTISFTVRVRSVSLKEVPALDDEFAKDHGECSTLEELRQRSRRQLEDEADQRADEAMRQALVTRLAERHDVPVPNALIHRRTEALMHEVMRDWKRQGIRPRSESEALEHVRAELEPRARQQVKVMLLLEAIAQHERLSVGDDEVDARISALAAAAGSAAERVRAAYQDPEARRQLHTRMLHARALDAVVQQAHITTVAGAASVAEPAENG
jgi:trigger factor